MALSDTLKYLNKYEEAIAWLKKGLKLYPEDNNLQLAINETSSLQEREVHNE